MKITVFSLVWDTAEGTDCQLFRSEAEWFAYFSTIITDDIAGIESPEAMEIRNALDLHDIGYAYELWQMNYKSELDSYNWDKYTIEIGASGEVLKIAQGDPYPVLY